MVVEAMRGNILLFAAGVLFGSMATAQETDRVIPLTHTDTHGIQQIANLVRLIAVTSNVTVDESKQTIAVQGTAEQVALAGWLCAELDRLPTAASNPERHDFPDAVSGGDKVRISYLAHVPTPIALQEMLNLTRAIADVQRASAYPQLNAIVVRSSADRLALTDWMMDEFDREAAPGSQVSHESKASFDPRDNMVQIFFFANTQTPLGVQEVINATRSISEVQRIFPYNALKAVCLRGSADGIALADWIMKELDKTASQDQDTAPHERNVPTSVWRDGGVARVFYLSNVPNAHALQEAVNAVRSEAKIQRAYPVHQVNAITVRGTSDEVARAEQIIKQYDR
jgi:type II secretory pathway component GspD/PulD (secretin)